jgi:hypothetical protein
LNLAKYAANQSIEAMANEKEKDQTHHNESRDIAGASRWIHKWNAHISQQQNCKEREPR